MIRAIQIGVFTFFLPLWRGASPDLLHQFCGLLNIIIISIIIVLFVFTVCIIIIILQGRLWFCLGLSVTVCW